MLGISGIGVLAALLMKGLPLHTHVDEQWGLEEKEGSVNGKEKTRTGDEEVPMKETNVSVSVGEASGSGGV